MEEGKAKGNCYAASEALYHLLGGKEAGWTPMYISRYNEQGDAHWYLKHENGFILDATASQFKETPDYSKGRGCGFLTDAPSKKAQFLMVKLVWQDVDLVEDPDDLEKLRAFAKGALGSWPDSWPDGGDLQDLALKHGLLEEVEMKRPCGDGDTVACPCAEFYGEDEWPVTCLRFTDLVKGE